MENTEIIDFLRENLRIEISMDNGYENGRLFVNSNVRLYLGDEEISRDYDSVCVNNG